METKLLAPVHTHFIDLVLKKKEGSVVCLYTPVSPSVPEIEGIYATG